MDAHFAVYFQNPNPPPRTCAQNGRIRSEMAGGGRRCAYGRMLIYLKEKPSTLRFHLEPRDHHRPHQRLRAEDWLRLLSGFFWQILSHSRQPPSVASSESPHVWSSSRSEKFIGDSQIVLRVQGLWIWDLMLRMKDVEFRLVYRALHSKRAHHAVERKIMWKGFYRDNVCLGEA